MGVRARVGAQLPPLVVAHDPERDPEVGEPAGGARALERAERIGKELRHVDVRSGHVLVSLRSHPPQGQAGAASSCGRSSVMSYHGAFEPTKMWRCGRIPGSSSRLPMGTMATPRSGATRGRFEPHRLQKTVVKKRASGTL